MDDSQTRRGRPCTHRLFGEPVALLAAFSLVALAGRLPLERPAESLVRFQRRLLGTMDCSSLMAGQVMDLAAAGAERTSEEISDLKTVPLFRIAIEAGAVHANLTCEQSCALDTFGREFGLAYQLVDDYLDGELHELAPIGRRLSQARAALAPFGSRAWQLEEMLDYLNGKTFEADHRSR
jgi:geranylgeranyl pyrophosphate synthase